MKEKIFNYGYLFGLAGILIALDQITKAVVRTQLPVGGSWSPWPWIEPLVQVVHWKNDGSAFGMFQGFNNVFKVMAIIISGVIIYYYPRIPRQDWYLRLAMGLQLGGALGNVIDRFYQGYVTDFIILLPIWHFPVFNIADLSITSGVIVLLIGMWINERKQPKPETQNMGPVGPENGVPPTQTEETQGG